MGKLMDYDGIFSSILRLFYGWHRFTLDIIIIDDRKFNQQKSDANKWNKILLVVEFSVESLDGKGMKRLSVPFF